MSSGIMFCGRCGENLHAHICPSKSGRVESMQIGVNAVREAERRGYLRGLRKLHSIMDCYEYEIDIGILAEIERLITEAEGETK